MRLHLTGPHFLGDHLFLPTRLGTLLRQLHCPVELTAPRAGDPGLPWCASFEEERDSAAPEQAPACLPKAASQPTTGQRVIWPSGAHWGPLSHRPPTPVQGQIRASLRGSFQKTLLEQYLPPVGGSQLQMAGRRGGWPGAHPCLSAPHRSTRSRWELKSSRCAQQGEGWEPKAGQPHFPSAGPRGPKTSSKNRSDHHGPIHFLQRRNQCGWSPPPVSLLEVSGFAAVLWAFSVFLRR